jgi:transcriptional regulator with XRE-family HTH domain
MPRSVLAMTGSHKFFVAHYIASMQLKDMRTSSHKTTAAVLREKSGTKEIAINADEWAKMLGRSVQAIQNIESGRTKLTPELATKMYYNTGISLEWLMDGDPTAPPVSTDGRPYTNANFEGAQARKKYFATSEDYEVGRLALKFFRAICAILVNANRKQRNYPLAVYRTAKALGELRAEFGEAEDLDSVGKVLAYIYPRTLPKEKSIEDVDGYEVEWKPLFKPKSKQPSKKRRK